MAQRHDERRRHKRTDLSCRVTVSCGKRDRQATGKTMNVSDGGAVLSLPVKSLPELKEMVHVRLSLPRSTPNTHMIEEFDTQATVLRHELLHDDRYAGMAIRFTKGVDLGLEV